MLARREHASGELLAKLIERGYDAVVCQGVIDELIDERFLDDVRFASVYVRSHAARGHGPRRLKQDMSAAGLPADLIEAALAEGPDWHQLAQHTRQRKFGEELPADWAERSRQSRFLQYRGFSNDHIRSAMGSSAAQPDMDDETDL
jgi:regulatory protein